MPGEQEKGWLVGSTGTSAPPHEAREVIRSLPPAGKAGEAALGACRPQLLKALDVGCLDQCGHRLAVAADDDRFAILGPPDARSESGLGLCYGKCAGHFGPPPGLEDIMVIKTIMTIIFKQGSRKGQLPGSPGRRCYRPSD